MARALAADPPVLLMDEPFGAVDPVVRVRLQDEFLRLQRELGKTVVLVTHDIDEAVRMGDRVAVFADRRPAGAVRHPGRAARAAPPTTSSPTSWARPAACAGSPSPRSTPPTSSRSTASAPATSAPPSTSTPRSRRRWPCCCATTGRSSGVKQGAQFVGVLTPNGVHRALRESLREASA